jgi:hypothetical protein
LPSARRRTAPRRSLALFRLFYQVEIRHRQHPRSAIRAPAPASVSSDWHASATAVPPRGLRPTRVPNPPCESALTSARSHLFRVVCDQAQAWATPEAIPHRLAGSRIRTIRCDHGVQ